MSDGGSQRKYHQQNRRGGGGGNEPKSPRDRGSGGGGGGGYGKGQRQGGGSGQQHGAAQASSRFGGAQPPASTPPAVAGEGPQSAGGSTNPSNSSQTPTTTSPTSAFPRDQILSSAGGMVAIKYFDEQTGLWGMRRPASNAPQPLKAFTISTIALGAYERTTANDAERSAALSDTLSTAMPTFVAVMEVSEPLFAALQAQPFVRRNYAMTDLAKCPGGDVDQGCIFLFRQSVHVDFAEFQPRLSQHNRAMAPRPFVLLHMRNFNGSSCTLGAVHFDPNSTLAERCTAIASAVGRLDADDIVALAANFGDQVSDAKETDLRREVAETMRAHAMLDAAEVCTEGGGTQAPIGLWVKAGGKVVPQSISSLPGDRRWCRFGNVVVLPFRAAMTPNTGPAAVNGTGGGIAIPQPRSAKTSKNSPSMTIVAGDPAVVAMDERLTPTPASLAAAAAAAVAGVGSSDASSARQQSQPRDDGINVASIITAQVKPKLPRFRKDTVFHIKGNNRNLTHDEAHYDLSGHFSSVSEALDTLNAGGFAWAADYFIVNSTIIAADHVPQCDLKSFRKYVQSKPNPWTLAGLVSSSQRSEGPPPAAGSGGGTVNVAQLLAEKASRKEARPVEDTPPARSAGGMGSMAPSVPPGHGASAPHHHTGHTSHHHHQSASGPVVRPRVWSDACCTLIYQVTPKEMKFDISVAVGAMRGNLKTAITRLNTKKTMAAALSEKPDPLLDYAYDYALLYCPERQAYWLLAASDVPCDIVSCRHAAS